VQKLSPSQAGTIGSIGAGAAGGELRGGAVLQLLTLCPASSPHPASAHHLLKPRPLRGGTPLRRTCHDGGEQRRRGGWMEQARCKGCPDICFSAAFSPCLPRHSRASLLPRVPRHSGLLKVWDIHPAAPPCTEGEGSPQPSLPKDGFGGAPGHLAAFSAPSPVSVTPHHTRAPRKRWLFLVTAK